MNSKKKKSELIDLKIEMISIDTICNKNSLLFSKDLHF